MPKAAAAECVLCKHDQRVTVARSSDSSSVYYRVVFHGGSCGPWMFVSPPVAPAVTDLIPADGGENVLRISYAEHAALLLLHEHGSNPSSVRVDRSSQAARALRFPSLAAAAAALAAFPAASSFALSHTPRAVNAGDSAAKQPLRSRLVVHTDRPPLLPGLVVWRISSDVVVVPRSERLYNAFIFPIGLRNLQMLMDSLRS